MNILETPRLFLRHWESKDIEPFAKINSDPEVMHFFPKILTLEESESFIQKVRDHYAKHNFGLFACESKKTNAFIGYIGLCIPTFETDFTPCVEIGWRLAKEYWNQGFATEAAQKTLEYAFEILKLQEVFSFTVPNNIPSRRVMEKIGMNFIKNFEHPSLPDESPLKKHVLYKISNYLI